MQTAKQILLAMLAEAFDQEAWHGANLMQTLRQLNAAQASAPSPHEGYTAWQVALHCAYWKWRTRKSLDPSGTGSFGRGFEDWPQPLESLDERRWRADLELLEEEHRLLRAAVEAMSEERLLERQPQGGNSYARSVYAIAAHDVYHTGMIRNMGIPGASFR